MAVMFISCITTLIREKVTGIKDSKKCILTKEACEELIKRFSVIYIKEDE